MLTQIQIGSKCGDRKWRSLEFQCVSRPGSTRLTNHTVARKENPQMRKRESSRQPVNVKVVLLFLMTD